MNHNKEIIAENFLNLLDEKPFSKITVKDIATRCNINRNTFYYHYQDIPSLLKSILTARIDQMIREHREISSWEECIESLVEYFLENKRAVLHVYRSMQREVFLTELNRLCRYMVDEFIKNASGDTYLSPEDENLLVRYFSCILIGVFLDWLDHDMEYNLIEDAYRISELQGNFVKTIFSNVRKTD